MSKLVEYLRINTISQGLYLKLVSEEPGEPTGVGVNEEDATFQYQSL